MSTYLKERKTDALADEVRKQVLVEELRQHFQEMANQAPEVMRRRLDASRSEVGGSWPGAPISLAGFLGLPARGSSSRVVAEWTRMYASSSKDSHLLQALQEHTRNSELWDHWDDWREQVEDYENAGRKVYNWVFDRTEAERWKKIDPEHIDSIRRWLFGNLLLKASGGDYEALEHRGRELTTMGGREIVARGADPDKALALRDWLVKLLEEAEKLPEWARLKSAAAKMMGKQPKLMALAERIDAAIEGVALMRAFPGRCHLCPV